MRKSDENIDNYSFSYILYQTFILKRGVIMKPGKKTVILMTATLATTPMLSSVQNVLTNETFLKQVEIAKAETINSIPTIEVTAGGVTEYVFGEIVSFELTTSDVDATDVLAYEMNVDGMNATFPYVDYIDGSTGEYRGTKTLTFDTSIIPYRDFQWNDIESRFEVMINVNGQVSDGLDVGMSSPLSVLVTNNTDIGKVIPNDVLYRGENKTITLSNYFVQTEGQSYTYEILVEDTNVVAATEQNGELTLQPNGLGKSVITVTATDDGGNQVVEKFGIDVLNKKPEFMPVNLEPTTLSDGNVVVDLSTAFTDADSTGGLVYTVEEMVGPEQVQGEIASFDLTNSTLTITPLKVGIVEYQITAMDVDGGVVVGSVNLMIESEPPMLSVVTTGDMTKTSGEKIIIEGTATDAEGEEMTVMSSIAGVMKTTTVVDGQWSLEWNVDEIETGTYSDIMINVSDQSGGNSHSIYQGTVTVERISDTQGVEVAPGEVMGSLVVTPYFPTGADENMIKINDGNYEVFSAPIEISTDSTIYLKTVTGGVDGVENSIVIKEIPSLISYSNDLQSKLKMDEIGVVIEIEEALASMNTSITAQNLDSAKTKINSIQTGDYKTNALSVYEQKAVDYLMGLETKTIEDISRLNVGAYLEHEQKYINALEGYDQDIITDIEAQEVKSIVLFINNAEMAKNSGSKIDYDMAVKQLEHLQTSITMDTLLDELQTAMGDVLNDPSTFTIFDYVDKGVTNANEDFVLRYNDMLLSLKNEGIEINLSNMQTVVDIVNAENEAMVKFDEVSIPVYQTEIANLIESTTKSNFEKTYDAINKSYLSYISLEDSDFILATEAIDALLDSEVKMELTLRLDAFNALKTALTTKTNEDVTIAEGKIGSLQEGPVKDALLLDLQTVDTTEPTPIDEGGTTGDIYSNPSEATIAQMESEGITNLNASYETIYQNALSTYLDDLGNTSLTKIEMQLVVNVVNAIEAAKINKTDADYDNGFYKVTELQNGNLSVQMHDELTESLMLKILDNNEQVQSSDLIRVGIENVVDSNVLRYNQFLTSYNESGLSLTKTTIETIVASSNALETFLVSPTEELGTTMLNTISLMPTVVAKTEALTEAKQVRLTSLYQVETNNFSQFDINLFGKGQSANINLYDEDLKLYQGDINAALNEEQLTIVLTLSDAYAASNKTLLSENLNLIQDGQLKEKYQSILDTIPDDEGSNDGTNDGIGDEGSDENKQTLTIINEEVDMNVEVPKTLLQANTVMPIKASITPKKDFEDVRIVVYRVLTSTEAALNNDDRVAVLGTSYTEEEFESFSVGSLTNGVPYDFTGDIQLEEGTDYQFKVAFETTGSTLKTDTFTVSVEGGSQSKDYFADVDQNTPEIEAIYSSYENGYLVGYELHGLKYFKPNQSMTRAEATVMLVRYTDAVVSKDGETSFIDSKGTWYEAELITAEKKNWVFGYFDRTFRGNQGITRAELAAVLARVIETNPNTRELPVFQDVSPEHWAKASIELIYQQSILNEEKTGYFDPDGLVTRAEMAVILQNLN